MLRLNAMKSKLVMTLEQNSYTTNVKVKPFSVLVFFPAELDSNTTNVKVKRDWTNSGSVFRAIFKYNQC